MTDSLTCRHPKSIRACCQPLYNLHFVTIGPLQALQLQDLPLASYQYHYRSVTLLSSSNIMISQRLFNAVPSIDAASLISLRGHTFPHEVAQIPEAHPTVASHFLPAQHQRFSSDPTTSIVPITRYALHALTAPASAKLDLFGGNPVTKSNHCFTVELHNAIKMPVQQ